ncbi:hypothetical protein CEXT_480601 [Caerostris extrusa]|uniref:Uncharacterized protein n=1 Tax=Caerostris extrusa TaxID=172846 RepID=A0AAV4NGJ0_CAEEX|nr:hypothetical protein CEXT_480601 [Caerostris extrusa]
MIRLSSRFRYLVDFDDSEPIEQIESVPVCVKEENSPKSDGFFFLSDTPAWTFRSHVQHQWCHSNEKRGSAFAS